MEVPISGTSEMLLDPYIEDLGIKVTKRQRRGRGVTVWIEVSDTEDLIKQLEFYAYPHGLDPDFAKYCQAAKRDISRIKKITTTTLMEDTPK